MGHCLRSHASRGSNYKLSMARGAVSNDRKCFFQLSVLNCSMSLAHLGYETEGEISVIARDEFNKIWVS